MIGGLTGSICSGKETMARYLVENHGFKAVNILDLSRKHMAEQNNIGRKDANGEEPKYNNKENLIGESAERIADDMSPYKFSE